MKKKILSILLVVCIINLTSFIVATNINEEDNANLEYLVCGEDGLTPFFTKYITNYELYVDSSINKIDIKASPEVKEAKVTIIGNEDLEIGDNQIIIKVTSKSGNITKEYKIIITKGIDNNSSDSYLEDLIVDNFPITPIFSSQNFIYDIGKIGQDIKKIDIIPITRNADSSVKIVGNTELKDGKNQVIVTVTSKDTTTKKEYIINYEKTNLPKEEKNNISEGGNFGDLSAIPDEFAEKSVYKDNLINKIMKFKIVIIVIILIIILILRYKKK